MEKENFIALLQRDNPVEIREFLERRSKRKKIDPVIYFEEIPPDKSVKTDINKKKVITAKADDIKEI